MDASRRVTRGRAITDKLAMVLGPAQVGNYVEPRRPTTADQRARGAELRTSFRRVVSPDGSVRLEQIADDGSTTPGAEQPPSAR